MEADQCSLWEDVPFLGGHEAAEVIGNKTLDWAFGLTKDELGKSALLPGRLSLFSCSSHFKNKCREAATCLAPLFYED